MSIIIAGERSGVGKTTITLALLSWLKEKGEKVQSFKVGPDYIDPMFHSRVTGFPCRNLDPILTSEDYLKSSFNYHSQGKNFAVIEGVMGLFDGLNFRDSPYYGSTAHIAKLLDLPVILIIDCSRLSGSVSAIALGYSNLDPNVTIAGVILNKVASEKHLEYLKKALQLISMPILGVFFRNSEITIPDRHLGLIPTEEIDHYPQIFKQLAAIAQTSFNWDLLLPLLQFKYDDYDENFILIKQTKRYHKKIIAIALDPAFNFYYQDNLDILQNHGAELIYWSPLKDKKIPHNVDMFYFGGGFPEVFAQPLSENEPIKQQLKQSILSGIPTYAECGGMMYLSEYIEDFEGQQWPMAGILPNTAKMSKKLTLGYRKVEILKNNFFAPEKTILWGHEFHRAINSCSSHNPLIKVKDAYSNQLIDYQGWYYHNTYASYIHLHFGQSFCSHLCPILEKQNNR